MPAPLQTKVVVTGNPVRPAVLEAAKLAYPGFEDGAFRLLVTGGSQGARVMADIVPEAIAALPEHLRARIRLVQQTRAEDIPRVEAIYQGAGVDAEIAPFFDDLPARIAAAHFVIARSGASTVSELAVIGRPALFVPLPGSLDGDQAANAAFIEQAGAAETVKQSDFSPAFLACAACAACGKPRRVAPRRAKSEKRWRRRRGRTPRRSGAASGRRDCANDACGSDFERSAKPRFRGRLSQDETAARDLGPIHFVGIGGIGMSGIAEVLVNLGYKVQGSDAAENANVKRLSEKGATVFIGHDARALGEAPSSSSRPRSSATIRARRRARKAPAGRAPRRNARRADAPQAMRRHRRHAWQDDDDVARRDAARRRRLDPTVINGGIINAYGTNARLGGGEWMVVEADESDGTFLKLPADVAIVTNIDPEHLDHFHTFDAIKDAFRHFIENLPFYGFAVMCLDHPTVQELVGKIEDRRVITYGENPQADVRLLDVNLEGGVSRFNVLLRDRKTAQATYLDNLVLPMPGHHNALNATAAITVAYQLGLSPDQIRKALAGFGGVKRRFTQARASGTASQIFDDYGHHPVEISAVLRARARLHQGQGRRRDAAASLYAPAIALRRLLDLLQRRRRRDRRGCLRGG